MKHKALFELACFELAVNAQCPVDRPDYCPYRQEKEYPANEAFELCLKCWEEYFIESLKEQEEIKKKVRGRK